MGAQWKQTGRVANAAKRGALIGKLIKEVLVAAKVGGANPEGNARLRAAVEAAKKASVPRDTLERALKKASGQTDEQINFEVVTYEGFAPSKVPVIVECLTDNKNRTAAEIRQLFRKGVLGSIGSVGWMFDRVGIIEATHPDKSQDIEGVAIEAGAQNVEPLEAEEVPAGSVGARFITDPTDLDSVTHYLTDRKWVLTMSELSYLAKERTELGDAERKEVVDFLNAIDDFDDVRRVYTALK
jgi:YebC/PmpR family DNA-binding regulatory protein